MMLWTECNKLGKNAKNWSQNSQISKIWLIFFDSVLFVAMATPHMILQMFYFLIMQNKSDTKSMMLWTNSTSLQKLLKIDL